MPLKQRVKATASEIVAIVAAIIGFLPSVFKKKAFTLWYYERIPVAGWKEISTFSKRQCEKTKAELIRLGCEERLFTILRKGVKPPAGEPK